MLPQPFKSRHTEDLRRGRISTPGANYFLTWCTAGRAPLLNKPAILASARLTLAAIEPAQDGSLLAATIMPDHLHLLLTLGARLTISQIVAKVKASLTRKHREITWQTNFFEHQIRTPEALEAFAFYVFMNPYCAKLCSIEQPWPGWISTPNLRWKFEDQTQLGGLPQPEWLNRAEQFRSTLPPGAD